MADPGAGDVHVPTTDGGIPKRRLRKLAVTRVDLVDRGANQHAHVPLFKRDDSSGDCQRCGGSFDGEGDRLCEDCAKISKREFSSDQRQGLAAKGRAMPDGSYPIETVEDLHNAVQAIGRAKNPAATKAHVIRQARRLKATDSLPDSWKVAKMEDIDAAFAEVEKIGRKLSAKTLASLKAAHDALHGVMGDEAHDKEEGMAKGNGETGRAKTDASYTGNGTEGGSKSDPDDDEFDDDEGIEEETENGAAKGQKGKAAVKRDVVKSDEIPEAIAKELSDLRKRAEAAEVIAKAERDARLDAEAIVKMEKEMPGVDAKSLAPILRRMNDTERVVMETQLKSLAAQSKESALFKSIGTDGSGLSNGSSVISQIEAIAKSAGSSFEDALMTPQGAQLYDQYLAQKGGK